MYRTNDPRFRRRLNEIGQTLENANESAQSSIYIFGQNYVKPCLHSVGTCLTTCIDASCPSLNLISLNPSQRDRLRRQRERGRSRGRAELNFDFYDDWDDDEVDGLLGWGNDEFSNLVADGGTGGIGGAAGGYGTVLPQNTQPARQQRGHGMIYGSTSAKKGTRRRSGTYDSGPGTLADPNVIQPGPSSLFGKLFGGKALRYKPSAAGLQEHPGTRRLAQSGGLTEGERLLNETNSYDKYAKSNHPSSHHHEHKQGRARSATQLSATTTDSYSSRGDIFPSDEEADAIPLDDEFAMVLERRTTQSLGAETESSGGSGKLSRSSTGDFQRQKRRKRPSVGSYVSSRRTLSERSLHTRSRDVSGADGRGSRADISILEDAAPIPYDEIERAVERLHLHDTTSGAGADADAEDEADDPSYQADSHPQPPRRPSLTLSDLKREEKAIGSEQEAAYQRQRSDAQRLALERGLLQDSGAATAGEVEIEHIPKNEQPPSHTPNPLPPSSSPLEEDLTNAPPASADEPKS